MNFTETEEQQALRKAVAELGRRYGHDYAAPRARAREPLTELWAEAGKSGFIGLNLPEEYGGGGAGMYELSLVCEELNAAGCGLLMMVVSPAINGTIIARFGTDEQKQRWLPGLADGSVIMAFGITEPDAGSNSHRITTTARRDGGDWLLTGRKYYVSGVDHAQAILIVARTEDAKTGRLKPALFVFPTDTPGFEYTPIDMDVVMPDKQFMLYMDDVRLPADALVGAEDAALAQLFAGLNPERIMAAAGSVGMGRYALDKAVAYANQREVWGKPIGTHQGLAHPLAKCKVELELSKLMMQKAASLYDSGDDLGAGEAANMAKYAAAEASIACVDQAVQTHGGNGLAHEYGLGNLLIGARVARIAPVSREMILNFVAQFSLGLPKSYLMPIAYAVERGIATITLDNPDNRNALSKALVEAVGAHLAAAAVDSAVRAVVVTHTGRTFCAGADLKEQAAEGGPAEGTRRMLALLRAIVELPKPVIACVDGHVRAGGVGLVGACDLALAGPLSTFAFTEVRLGLAPAIISLTTLPRMTARAASRYYLTGETFGADTAAEIGLVTTATENLDGELTTVCDALRACSPQGLAETKPLTTAAARAAFDAGAQDMQALSQRLFESEEAREGIMSFLQKRPPRWAAT